MRGLMKAASIMAGGALAVTLAAAPLAAQAGPRQGPRMGRGMMAGGPAAMLRNPVAVVLDHQEELELSADQVSQIEALKAKLDEENGPRWEQLKAAFGDADPSTMTAEERQALRDRMQELQPVRQEVQTANRAVMSEVHELLNADQETALRGIMRRGPQGQGRPGMRGRGGPPGGQGMAYRRGFRAGMARCQGAGAGPIGPGGASGR